MHICSKKEYIDAVKYGSHTWVYMQKEGELEMEPEPVWDPCMSKAGSSTLLSIC